MDLVSVEGVVMGVCIMEVQNGQRSDILLRESLVLSECIRVTTYSVYLGIISAIVGQNMEEQMWMATGIKTMYLQRRWIFVDKDTEGWMKMMGLRGMVVQMDKAHLI
jgi:hypothetical protein